MDNFGIFKLITSFSDFLTKNKQPDANESFGEKPIFQTLKQAQNRNSDADKPVSSTPAEIRASLPPLKNSMLSTMSSHDAFVKRVKEKNKK